MTIGYLASYIFMNYHCTFWERIKETCERRNVNCLCFSGGDLKSPEIDEYSKNKIFDLISNKAIDGIIINSSIFTFVTSNTILKFFEKYRGIPIVNIGLKVKDIPAILIDNASGMQEEITHLITDHGYKNIAFIKGPEYNKDAELRYLAYKYMLAKFGIPVDPELVEKGDFLVNKGMDCFEKLMKKNKKIDAIVAGNDDMALGALEKAQEMGIDIPGDIALVGFDDIEKARFSIPPLTTVYQPLFEQAENAVEMLIDLIEKRKPLKTVVLPTKFVIRRSCGCFSKTMYNASISVMKNKTESTVTDLKNHYDSLMNQLLFSFTGDIKSHYLELQKRLFNSFIFYMEEEEKTSALSELYMIVDQAVIKDNDDIDKWQNILSEWRRLTLPFVKNDISTLMKAESFWHRARVLMQEIGTHSQAYLKIKSEQKAATMREISEELIMNFDLAQLLETMTERLPHLGVESFYLSLFEDRIKESDYSRLILAFNGNKRVKIPSNGIRFKTKDLLPESIKSSHKLHDFILEALFFEKEKYGFILFKLNPREIQVEALRQQISTALKGAVLIEEVFDKENKLAALIRDQENRAKELEYAYNKLRVNQEKMIIMEKMASLGRMTAGIAHEMNTPLAAIRASLLELEGLINEYDLSIGDPEVTAGDHTDINKDMNASITIAQKASARVANFLQSIKFQTRDTSSRDRCIFNAVATIKDTILLMNHTLRKNNCSVNFKSVNDSIKLYGSRGKLSQVVTNLLRNAIDAYRDRHGGPISIELMYTESGVDLLIADKGAGIKKSDLVKIFDPMFTTKSLGEGTGLGLTIVHNIIAGDFGGGIDVQSRIGQGTTFVIHFPAPPIKNP